MFISIQDSHKIGVERACLWYCSFHHRIRTKKFNEALRNIKSGKAVEANDILIKVSKCAGGVSLMAN